MGVLGNLRQTLRKLAYHTSVDELRKRGVKKVSVLGIDRIAVLIEEAVERTLKHRLLGLERAQIADATREEFLRLLQSNEKLERSRDDALRLKRGAEDQVDALRRQLAEARKSLEERLERAATEQRARYEGEDSRIRGRIDEILGAGAGQELRARVTELVLDLVGRERAEAIQARQAVHDREVELLERRIAKLASGLEDTERRLVQIASIKKVDEGISSIYREVQGLAAGDAQLARKRELMAGIFRANLALQKKGAQASADHENDHD